MSKERNQEWMHGQKRLGLWSSGKTQDSRLRGPGFQFCPDGQIL